MNNDTVECSRQSIVRNIYLIILISITVFAVVVTLNQLKQYECYCYIENGLDYEEDCFRSFHITPDVYESLLDYCDDNQGDFYEELTLRMIWNDFVLDDVKQVNHFKLKPAYREQIEQNTSYQKLYHKYEMILSDLNYFPIPKDVKKGETVGFENSWMDARSYGGKRFHEGCDIIPSIDERGYFPVVSMTSGVVTKKGWLEKGGYRIGVTSPSGGYFYYAHLDSYADGLAVGDIVEAGQLLGYMGDTGYGKTEGTKGLFVVHLHLGIYLNEGEQEESVNPYWILKYLEPYQSTFE